MHWFLFFAVGLFGCESPIAQLVERAAVNLKVAGSNPAGRVLFCRWLDGWMDGWMCVVCVAIDAHARVADPVVADPVVSLWFGAGPRWWLCGAKRRQSWWLS